MDNERKNRNVDEIIEVEVIKLDDYLKAQNITDIRMLKVDVEGYELVNKFN